MSSTYAEEIETLIRARYPVLYIVSYEESRVENLLQDIAVKRNKRLMTWSISRGLLPYGTSLQSSRHVDESTRDPGNALDQVVKAVEPAIYLFKDFHPFLCDPTISRKVRELALYLKNTYTTLVLVSPTQKIPLELEKDIAVCQIPLPDVHDLRDLLDRTIDEVNKGGQVHVQLDDAGKERVLQATLGLTLTEAENVFAKALVRDGKLDSENLDTILSEKEQLIRKSGLLEYYRAQEQFHDVGGYDLLKVWLMKRQAAFSERAREFGLPAPKGVLLIGVQGCGKSLSAKAVSSLWKVPLLRLDMGKVFSSLVGSSEENVRNAIRVAESVAPAILWIDEIEKAFAGVQSSAFSDAGTTARVFGNFLTWLQEKTAPVFVIATANNVQQLPAELLRKGRLDDIFFVDLPTQPEREEIFSIHLRRRKRDPKKFDLKAVAQVTSGFSGAEIEEAVISALFDVFSVAQDITTEAILKSVSETVPLSKTMKEQIDELREWAGSRARRASSQESEAIEAAPMGRKLELA
ncbi:MAG: AAA family ATPase [Armatimonadetes bacterium]|nr:AAA family ATPase [Armatimonadota bacterium]